MSAHAYRVDDSDGSVQFGEAEEDWEDEEFDDEEHPQCQHA